MSHKSTIKTELKNIRQDVFDLACRELGLTSELRHNKTEINGYGQMTVEGKDIYVVSGFGGNYQLAVIDNKDNEPCQFECDEYRGHIEKTAGKKGERLSQVYNAHLITEQARMQGFQVFSKDAAGHYIAKTPQSRFAFNDKDEIAIQLRRLN